MDELLSVPRPAKIVSGGQTGVDRAALDLALMLGIPHGGFCPLGRRAEDGRIAERYLLSETESPKYNVRTERNVLESNATLILCHGPLTGGTRLTQRLAIKHARPCLVLDLAQPAATTEAAAWLRQHGQEVLNIAGPRESQSPGIGKLAHVFLQRLWQPPPERRA